MAANFTGDGSDAISNTVIARKRTGDCWEYDAEEQTFTKIKNMDLIKDDEIIYASNLWYVKPLIIRIKK